MKRALCGLLVLASAACGTDSPTALNDTDLVDVPAPSLILIPGATYECAQPATASATSSASFGPAANAINCDDTDADQWNSGGGGSASITVNFAAPREISGLHITMNALPAAFETYTIYGTTPGGSEEFLTKVRFPVADVSVSGVTQWDFDFGTGFALYESVRVLIGDVSSSSWIGVNEIELIVPGALCQPGTYDVEGFCFPALPGYFAPAPGMTAPVACPAGTYQPNLGSVDCLTTPAGSSSGTASSAYTPCAVGSYQPLDGQPSCLEAPVGSYVDQAGATAATVCPAGTTTLATGSTSSSDCVTSDADGDGVVDDVDAFPHSNLAPLVGIEGCSTGVGNQVLANGASFNDLLGQAYASAGNHGQFVKAVASLTGGWKKAGLISGRDEGQITSCAARTK